MLLFQALCVRKCVCAIIFAAFASCPSGLRHGEPINAEDVETDGKARSRWKTRSRVGMAGRRGCGKRGAPIACASYIRKHRKTGAQSEGNTRAAQTETHGLRRGLRQGKFLVDGRPVEWRVIDVKAETSEVKKRLARLLDETYNNTIQGWTPAFSRNMQCLTSNVNTGTDCLNRYDCADVLEHEGKIIAGNFYNLLPYGNKYANMFSDHSSPIVSATRVQMDHLVNKLKISGHTQEATQKPAAILVNKELKPMMSLDDLKLALDGGGYTNILFTDVAEDALRQAKDDAGRASEVMARKITAAWPKGCEEQNQCNKIGSYSRGVPNSDKKLIQNMFGQVASGWEEGDQGCNRIPKPKR